MILSPTVWINFGPKRSNPKAIPIAPIAITQSGIPTLAATVSSLNVETIAIVSTFSDETVAAKVGIPLWVMAIGAIGIAFGLLLFGPKLIHTVGDKITRLNAPRAYCVAIASAITVLIATTLGLPVSSTHIAIGAIFGIGFLREFIENPNRKRLRPAHRINATAADAFLDLNVRLKRKLVRRRFVISIATAWVITVPSSAILAGLLYYVLQLLGPMAK